MQELSLEGGHIGTTWTGGGCDRCDL